jgi:hypothetical protein
MTPMEKVVAIARMAAMSGTYGGLIQTDRDANYISRCMHLTRSGVMLLFTRDLGYHASGWWKNPDYERCWHLSVSMFDVETRQPAQFNSREAMRWARAFYHDDVRWVWVEPPYSPAGKNRQVHHYRLFCDPAWQPLKPRGEVYSKEFTELGWRSFSEIHGPRAKDYGAPIDDVERP